MSPARAAVFLDRDGTINVDTGYVRRPEDVSLVPGAAAAIARLNAAHIPVIVISNQSGIGRGLLTYHEYERVQRRIDELLAQSGAGTGAGAGAEGRARIDATYICPHAPSDPPCACRKPGVALFRRAAAEHGLALAESWYIGDRWRDVAPALALGGHGILIAGPDTDAADVRLAHEQATVVTSLGDAIDLVLADPARRPNA